MSTTGSHTAETVEVGCGRIHLMKGGQGSPLLIFQDDLGSPGWLPFYKSLAQHHTVYVPHHPGFGESERPMWMRNVRDMAIVHLWLLKRLGLEALPVVGCGFGGWVAAEMATMNARQFQRLVLVGAVGLQPTEGEIVDQFLVSGEEYAKTCFHDPTNFAALFGNEITADQHEAWEINREMVVRVAWKPYMFNQGLPFLLGSVDVPTLVVRGREDVVVPASCSQRYVDALPNAQFAEIAGCGHCVDMEKPQELATLITQFIAGE